MKKGNINAYKGMDPDSIYDDSRISNGSLTFFFIPSNNNLYIKQNPATHADMLADDDKLFFDVYQRKRPQGDFLSSRGQALERGDAILGRIGIDGLTPLIAFWQGRVKIDSLIIGNFLKALYKQIPPFQAYQNSTVLLLPDEKPITVGELLGTNMPNPKRDVKLNLPKIKDKTFIIDGQKLNLSDLQALRSAIHTKNASVNPYSILCHPDIDKYPELKGYKPSNCNNNSDFRATHPAMWRRAGRNIGQYIYTPEHTSFKEWFLRNILQITQ